MTYYNINIKIRYDIQLNIKAGYYINIFCCQIYMTYVIYFLKHFNYYKIYLNENIINPDPPFAPTVGVSVNGFKGSE